jgi:hypothetical protein
VSQLMQKERDEEKDGSDDGGGPDDRDIPFRIYGVKVGGERESDEQGNDKPAVVQADFDPFDMAEL